MDLFDWMDETFGYEEERWGYEDRNYVNLYHGEEDEEWDISPEDLSEWENAGCGIDPEAPWLR